LRQVFVPDSEQRVPLGVTKHDLLKSQIYPGEHSVSLLQLVVTTDEVDSEGIEQGAKSHFGPDLLTYVPLGHCFAS